MKSWRKEEKRVSFFAGLVSLEAWGPPAAQSSNTTTHPTESSKILQRRVIGQRFPGMGNGLEE